MKKMNVLRGPWAPLFSGKTKLFTALAIIVFMIASCLPTYAQNDNLAASIDNLDDLVGCDEATVKAAKISDESFPTDDKSKIFFLYNVKTGLLLNAGGYWGTHVSLKEYGMPLWIHIDNDSWIHFAQKFDKSGADSSEGNYLEYENKNNTSNPDEGVYVDRNYKSGDYVVKRGWKLEAVTGKTNIYKLYTYRYNNSSFDNTKYYLIAFTEQGDVDKNCGAVKVGDSNIANGNDEWKIISYQQIFDLQDNQSQNITKSLDLTFRLQCPGFSRENAALSKWKTAKYSGDGQLRFGLEHFYKLTDGKGNIQSSYIDDFSNGVISSYVFPDGDEAITFTEHQNYERHCGKYYAAEIKNAHGAIYQDVTVSHGGAYVIECKGFSTTTKAKLFAVLLNDDKSSKLNTLHSTILGQTAYMSDAEKTSLHTDEQNMDYAAKEFYGNHKYFSSVLVQVPEGGGTIRFGIEVGSQGDATPNASDKEWTVFDDFRLLYASKTIDGDLVLDADRDELSYLKDCQNTYKNVTLHLNKSFTKDKWNGFILPVDLTRDQLTQAFGPNVRLAELHQVTDLEIQFESIDVTSKGNNEVVMKAYIPYIIFPTKHLELEQTPSYTSKLSKTGSNIEAKDYSVTVKKNHIDIPNVSVAIDANTNTNDLTNMNTTDWTTNSNTVVDAVTGSPIVSSNNKMTALGTFARTFGTGTQTLANDESDDYGTWTISNNSQIIDGRDNLKGCYFYDNGNMYYSAQRARGLRGFSIWFKPTTEASISAPAKLYLDGISLDETNSIKQLVYGEEEADKPVEKFRNGIYTLQGQLISKNSVSTSELPSGIYIINGKKTLVK